MLFNSYVFIFVFLPLTVGVFYLIKPVYRVGFLAMASLVFYAQWSVEATMLLLSSILANYLFACILPKLKHKKLFLALVIGVNLVPLVYFKYSVFLHFSTQSLILPLAISFYTFQQIAFLVDLYKEKIKQHTFGEYLFFVLFFPQLIAGPIVHYAQIIAQVRAGALARIQWQYVEAGIVLFSIGLFKKTVLADTFLPLATAAFSHTETLTTFAAWMGLMAYTLGIYFDFSGYTDMAIGLGLFFGLRLPINFDSPYKAVSMVDFWRRWHITLSHFLRDYVYIPLGGNIKGKYTEVLNLLITMMIGGLWHGSGWNFIVWGLLHGVFLALVHLRERCCHRVKLPKILSVLLTFTVVSLLWVLFRAQSLEEASGYYAVLFGGSGGLVWSMELSWIVTGLGIVWFLPNAMQFVHYADGFRKFGAKEAFIAAVLFFVSLKMIAEAPAQTFVYFNF
jgi:alginate O-acetyltransferase complex protein AlgI